MSAYLLYHRASRKGQQVCWLLPLLWSTSLWCRCCHDQCRGTMEYECLWAFNNTWFFFNLKLDWPVNEMVKYSMNQTECRSVYLSKWLFLILVIPLLIFCFKLFQHLISTSTMQCLWYMFAQGQRSSSNSGRCFWRCVEDFEIGVFLSKPQTTSEFLPFPHQCQIQDRWPCGRNIPYTWRYHWQAVFSSYQGPVYFHSHTKT